MKFRPLHDRVVVKRIEEEQKTKGGIIIPDTAKEKPMQGEVLAVGPGARNEKGDLIPLGVAGRRPRAVRQVVRHRGQARRRRAPDHEGKRHHGRARRERRPGQGRLIRRRGSNQHGRQQQMAAKEVKFSTDARTRMLKGVDHPRRRGEGHAGPEGPQRGARQELRRAADHQGRCDGRQGDRALRQVREHGRADGARGGLARPATSPATAPPPPPSWPRRSSARVRSRWPPA